MKSFEYCVQPLQSAEYYKNKLKELNEREKTCTKKPEDLDVHNTFKENTRELNYLLKLATNNASV